MLRSVTSLPLSMFENTRPALERQGDWLSSVAALIGREKRGRDLLQVVFEFLAARWTAQLAERLCFDLADALAGHHEFSPYLFERAAAAVFEPEPELQHLALARRQAVENVHHLLLEQ